MRTLLAALVALAVVGSGCIVVRQPRVGRSAAVAKKRCPPGHVWSDGSCRSRGHGNERSARAR